MNEFAYNLGLTLGALTGLFIVYSIATRIRPGQASETGITRRQPPGRPMSQPIGPVTLLKLALLLPGAILLSVLLTSLETTLIIAAGTMMAGTFDSPHGMESFRPEEHPWVHLVGFPFLFFSLGTILYFGSRRILGRDSLKAKRKLILGLCLFACIAPVVGVLALDGDSFAPPKPGKLIGIGALMLDITPLAGWQVERNDLAQINEAALIVTAPLVDDYAASLNLITTPLFEKTTLQATANQVKEACTHNLSNFTFIGQEQTILNGIPALSLTSTHQSLSPGVTSPRPLRMVQVLAIRNEQLFVFTCTALDSNYPQYKADFQFMLNSVHWR